MSYETPAFRGCGVGGGGPARPAARGELVRSPGGAGVGADGEVPVTTEPCGFSPVSRKAVAEHAVSCPRCRANTRRASLRGAAWEREHGEEVRQREADIYAARDARAAAWPPERVRALMAETARDIDNPP